MTATDFHLAKLASLQTSAIGVIIMAGSLAPGHIYDAQTDVGLATSGFHINADADLTPSYHSVKITDVTEITDGLIAEAFLGIHEMLASDFDGLDADAEKVLCDSLWDLYI